jgi:scyllo-inositol 2-dehydrogenase (NADP+)
MAAIRVLLVRGGAYHPFDTCAQALRETYEDGGFARCTLADRDTAFDRDLSTYDVVVLYTQGGTLTRVQEKRLCTYVRQGGGFVGFHCASDSYVDNPEFMKMIGTHFVTHAPGTLTFTVRVADPEHPLAENLHAFDIVDEFYVLEHKVDPAKLDVFLTAQWQGRAQPMAYTRAYGRGRVFYSANGHDERAFGNPAFQRLALRALLWAADRWRPMRRPIGVGLLGYGPSFGMGKLHGDHMKASGGFELVAACDTDPVRRHAAEQDFPGITTCTDSSDLLANKAVECIVCILPHNLHAQHVIAALRAGKHVIAEKPFCLTAKDAAAMLAEARKNKRVLTAYQNRRWDSHALTARRLVRSGVIGDVFETQIDLGSYAHPGDWWRSDKPISGGLVYDWGAHAIDWILQIIRDRVVGVSAYYQKRKWLMCSNEDHVRVILRFAGGAVANFANSQLYGATSPGWIILGTEGGLQFPTVFDDHATLTTYPHGVAQTTSVPCEPRAWPAFYENLADHVHHGAPLAVPPDSPARVISILETAEKSSKAGRELPFKDAYYRE